MAYNLDAIKSKISELSGGRKQKKGPKLNFFKPQLGNYEIRFLPYTDANGQPFQEVSYYDNKLLSERRFVAPAQFDQDDPIFDLLTELRKDHSKDTWKLTNMLRPKERFYAPILVRGEEDKGVQVWELNSKLLKDIYSSLAHPDYCDENLMDLENGYDFTLNVTDSGKQWNGYMVKEYDIKPRKKPSPALSTKKAREELLKQIPDLEDYFRSRVRDREWMEQIVENFLASRNGSEAEEGTDHNASNGSDNGSTKSAKNIEDAFADLDDDAPF